MKTKSKARKRILFLICAIFMLTFAVITSVTDNVSEILNNKVELAELEIYYEELIKEEDSLKSEVTKLSDPDYLARYAKEKYLYSEEGEIIIRFE